MIAKVESKRAPLALQWNTRVEIAARLLIIGFGVLGVFMGYFIAAGCAQANDEVKNITGVISHRRYEINYIVAGILGVLVAFAFFCFIGLPYMILKKAAGFRTWLIVSGVFAIIYYVLCFLLGIIYLGMFNTINNYLIIGFCILVICSIAILSSYFLLWWEVKKQWRLRKHFEYLNDEAQFKNFEVKNMQLEERRKALAEIGTTKYNKEKYMIEGITKNKKHILNQIHTVDEEKMEDVDIDQPENKQV